MSFEKNVFINCPFDDDYQELLRTLVFVVLYLGYEPRIAATKSSAHIRINEIKKLIKESKYSIHDISRCAPLNVGELPRFNMPYEMGLDIGCSEYGNRKMKAKLCLILEKEKDRYDKVISDISGQDIKNHDNTPETLVEKLRDWFATVSDGSVLSGSKLLEKFTEYKTVINMILVERDYTSRDIENMNHLEYIKTVKEAIQSELRRPKIGPITVTFP